MNRNERYKDSQVIAKYFIDSYCSYINDPDQKKFIYKGIIFAYEKHAKQLRVSKEPYFYHLYETAKILANYKNDYITITAGFLHDVIEDQNVTYEQIVEAFNEETAFLVKSVTKINSFFTSMPNNEVDNLNLKNLIISMAEDIRVILIKLADRLHNMRTLAFLPYEKQMKIAKQTFYIFCPIAERLGISDLANEFYDLCFYYLHEEEYIKLKEKYDKIISIDYENIQNIISKLKNLFATKTNLNIIKIEGRNKSLWSIWNKMQSRNFKLYELYDLTAIRIIVNNKINCYEVLGFLHEWFHSLNNRFKDYIANPKPNLYQSLHTAVVIDSVITEIQIRSTAMDNYANQGIIAHWRYKELQATKKLSKDDYRLSEIDDKLRLLMNYQKVEQLQNIKNTNKIEYMKQINEHIFYKYVYAMTPLGKTIILPKNSTVLDYAFKIHSKLPFYAYSCKVNGNIEPLDYKINTGDIIEILKSNVYRCGESYINKCNHIQNKQRIIKFLNQQKENRNIINKELAMRQIQKLLKNNNISNSDWSKILANILKFLQISRISIFYRLFENKNFKLKDVYEEYISYEKQIAEQKNKKHTNVISKSINKSLNYRDIVFADNIHIKYRLSSCCYPIFGDEIAAFVSKANVMKIHRLLCKYIVDITNSNEKNRIIHCEWNHNHNTSEKYICKINIIAMYNSYALNNVNKILIKSNIPIKQIKVNQLKNLRFLKIIIELFVKNLEEATKTIQLLSYGSDIIKIERI